VLRPRLELVPPEQPGGSGGELIKLAMPIERVLEAAAAVVGGYFANGATDGQSVGHTQGSLANSPPDDR